MLNMKGYIYDSESSSNQSVQYSVSADVFKTYPILEKYDRDGQCMPMGFGSEQEA